MRVGGRFDSPGRPLIHAAPTFAGAMLEVPVSGIAMVVPGMKRCFDEV